MAARKTAAAEAPVDGADVVEGPEPAPKKKRGRKPSVLGPAARRFEAAQAKVVRLEAKQATIDRLRAEIDDAIADRDLAQAELQVALDTSAGVVPTDDGAAVGNDDF